MSGGVGGTAKVPSLPPPRPKSPPSYPDLYGKRRELAKVQMLEREIGFLEDELKFVAGLQPASKSCKEVVDFVTANADPLMPTTKRIRKSCWLWRWLCGSSCFSFSWICCHGRVPKVRMPSCCSCNLYNCISCSCVGCPKPDCQCFSCCTPKCFRMPSCRPSCCCSCGTPTCPSSSCSCPCPCSCSCCCSFPNCFGNNRSSCTSCVPKCPKCAKCPKVNLCSCCTKDCCSNCCCICC